MGYLLDVAASHQGHSNIATQNQVLQTASLSRPVVDGGYAKVKFPRTFESVSQIVLLPGDKVGWKQ